MQDMLFIEVIFALSFIYFLASVIASGINEAISMLFNKRGLELKRAIRLLLNGEDCDWGDRFYEHPRLENLKEVPSSVSVRAIPQRLKNWVLRRKEQVMFNPSYIGSGLFADVLIEFIGMGAGESVKQEAASDLSKEELECIASMRRFLEGADPFSYRQFTSLYLSGSQPGYKIIEELRTALAARETGDFQAFKETATEVIDQYVSRHQTLKGDEKTLSTLKHRIVEMQSNPNFGSIQQFLLRSETLDDFKEKLESWFNSYMDRVSGWYKRRMHITIFWIALVVTLAGNLDSIAIVQNLIVNQQFRETVVTAAEQYIEDHPEGFQNATTFEDQIDSIKTHINLTRDLFLPVGPDLDRRIDLAKIAGWLLTVFAISLGAPFWFDMLNKIARLRAAGKKPDD